MTQVGTDSCFILDPGGFELIRTVYTFGRSESCQERAASEISTYDVENIFFLLADIENKTVTIDSITQVLATNFTFNYTGDLDTGEAKVNISVYHTYRYEGVPLVSVRN